MTLLAGSGFSRLDDAFEAGKMASRQALAPLNGEPPQIVVAFATCAYDQASLLQGVREVVGDVPCIGCSAGKVIGQQGPLAHGVVVLALHQPEMQVSLALEKGLSQHPATVADRVTEQLERSLPLFRGGKQTTALTLTDGIRGEMVTDMVLQHVTTMLGPMCSIVGGASGDMCEQRAKLFADGQVGEDALAMALISSPSPTGIGVRHGLHPLSQRLLITRSNENRIYQFDNTPALDTYRQLFDDDTLTAETFSERGAYHPLGFVLIDSELLIRMPKSAYPDGSIAYQGTLPGNAVAYIMESDPDSLLEAAQTATHQAVAALDGHPVAAAIVIGGFARPRLLGDKANREIEVVRDIVGHETPMIGMYSTGEFAADRGAVQFHQSAFVVWVIGQP